MCSSVNEKVLPIEGHAPLVAYLTYEADPRICKTRKALVANVLKLLLVSKIAQPVPLLLAKQFSY